MRSKINIILVGFCFNKLIEFQWNLFALLLIIAAFESLRQRIVEIGKGIPVAEALEAPEIYPHNHTN